MPVLERLVLANCSLELTHIEILHKNLPSITELRVESSYLADSEIPRDVGPATQVTTLQFDLDYAPDSQQIHIEFYKYLARKYPSVNDFHCFDSELSGQSKHYAVDIYDDGIFPLLQRIEPHLSGFTFENFCDGIEVFARLDEIGCQIKELIINSYHDDDYSFENLAKSNQAKTMEILELNDAVLDPAELTINMEVLRALTINCSNSYYDDDIEGKAELDLNELLKSCPSTPTYLSIECTRIKCIGSRAYFTSIIYLSLSQIDLTPALGKTIPTSFPNLLVLQLEGSISDNVTMSLSGQNLERVSIVTTHEKGRHNAFSVKMINNGKVEYYANKPIQVKDMCGKLKMEERTEPVSKEEVCDLIMLNFTCASVNHIMIVTWER